MKDIWIEAQNYCKWIGCFYCRSSYLKAFFVAEFLFSITSILLLEAWNPSIEEVPHISTTGLNVAPLFSFFSCSGVLWVTILRKKTRISRGTIKWHVLKFSNPTRNRVQLFWWWLVLQKIIIPKMEIRGPLFSWFMRSRIKECTRVLYIFGSLRFQCHHKSLFKRNGIKESFEIIGLGVVF